MRPHLSGRKTNGTLEAHRNGLRFISSKGEKLDILYSNIKVHPRSCTALCVLSVLTSEVQPCDWCFGGSHSTPFSNPATRSIWC